METVKIPGVIPHVKALMSYEQKDLTNLTIAMKYAGRLFEPIRVVERSGRYEVFDGLSRLLAAKQLHWEEIDVEICDLDDVQVEEQIALRNVKSNRTLVEKLKHAELILGILGKSQGKKRETIGDSDLGDDQFTLVGKDRFEIAAAVAGCDFKPTTLRRLVAVKDFEENGGDEEKKLGLMDKIANHGMKPNQAHRLMSNYLQEKNSTKENLIVEGLDYYEGNHHRLFNKTCEDLSDLQDGTIDTCIISPPYFDQRDYEDGKLPEGEIPHGEESTADAYIDKQVFVAESAKPKIKNTGSYFHVISETHCKTNLMITAKLILKMVDAGWYFVDEWIWKKNNQKPTSLTKRLQPTYEKILHFVKDVDSYYFREFKNWLPGKQFGVIKGSNDGERGAKKETGWSLKRPLQRFRNFLDEQHVAKVFETSVFNRNELREIDPQFTHPAPFPSYIPLLPILMTSRPGDTVLDLYNGTGTTAAVALQLGRNAIGYDTATSSHEFAAKRLRMVEENSPGMSEIKEFEDHFMNG